MFNSTSKIVMLAMEKAEISRKSGGKGSDQLYNALKEARNQLHFGGGVFVSPFSSFGANVALRGSRRRSSKKKKNKKSSFGKKKKKTKTRKSRKA